MADVKLPETVLFTCGYTLYDHQSPKNSTWDKHPFPDTPEDLGYIHRAYPKTVLRILGETQSRNWSHNYKLSHRKTVLGMPTSTPFSEEHFLKQPRTRQRTEAILDFSPMNLRSPQPAPNLKKWIWPRGWQVELPALHLHTATAWRPSWAASMKTQVFWAFEYVRISSLTYSKFQNTCAFMM